MTSAKIEYVAEATRIVRSFFAGALGAATLGMTMRWENEREYKRTEREINRLEEKIKKSKETEEILKQEINKLKWWWNRT